MVDSERSAESERGIDFERDIDLERRIDLERGIDAVLFDMDGTLVDSDAVVERVWRMFCAEYGIDVDELLAVAHGVPGRATIRRFLPGYSDADVDAIAARQLAREYDDLTGVVATDGALELIAALTEHGVPWAIVTSADRRLAVTRLDAAGIAVPGVLVTTGDVSAGKPDPEGYLLAAARLKIAAGRTLVVEDTEPGLAAGRAAGAYVAALKGLTGDLTIASLTDLTAVSWPRGRR